MKKFKLSIGWFSFLFSTTIVLIFSIISHFYIQESIATVKANEEHLISCYVNRITDKKQSVAEFKELIFGTIESFTHKIAIIDKNDNLIYSTFETLPTYEADKRTYYKEDNVYYNSEKYFNDIGIAKVIFKKEIDYTKIKEKALFIILSSLFFLIACSLFLYFHIKSINLNVTEKLDIFFKDAVHEIRTPLGVLQLNLDFLDNTINDSMPLKRAQAGLKNLTSVYESLEFYVKNKNIDYKKEDINLSRFLEKRINFFKVMTEIKNIEVISTIETDIYIHINRTELQRLIDNNLSNAIKYSKKNTEIAINLYEENTFIILNFSNYGERIKNTTKIFKRYYRGDEIKGGFGLGLSIVDYICSKYDILINVNSNTSGNTTFTYRIPPKIAKRDQN